MKEVLIKAKIKNLDEEIIYEGNGTLNEEEHYLKYKDNDATVTIFIKDDILLRETKDTILSYKFKEQEETNFEVYLKELNQRGHITLVTKRIEKEDNKYLVEYKIEGNDYYHLYEINWR